MSEIEFDDVIRIARASDQIEAAIVTMKPSLRRHRILRHDTWYDMRGVVDEIPKLAIIFTTAVGLSAGVQIPPKETGLSHLLLLPQLFKHDWNMLFIQSQSIIHHELAHMLVEGLDSAYGELQPRSPEYFNHPTEIGAYMHQAIAELASYGPSKQFSWTSGPLTPQELLGDDPNHFVTRVLQQYYPKAMQALTPENKDALMSRLYQLHHDAIQSFEMDAPSPGTMAF